MHRFYLPPEFCQGEILKLDGTEAHHALTVLRLTRGDTVTVLDGAGREFSCRVCQVGRRDIQLQVEQSQFFPEPACRVTLVQAIPKGKLFETIIQKATELGAGRIIPLLTERVVTQLDAESSYAKTLKWQQTAVEAIKQCGQPWLPKVASPTTLSNLLQQQEKPDLSLVGSLRTDAKHPREFFSAKNNPCSIAVWIGPEGDFTETELTAILAAGVQGINLGPLVLRCDTAASYILSVISYELQGRA